MFACLDVADVFLPAHESTRSSSNKTTFLQCGETDSPGAVRGKVVFLSTGRKHWLSFHASNAFLVIPFAWWPRCLPGSVGMLPPPFWLFLSFFFWYFSFLFFPLVLWLIPVPFLVCVQPVSMIPFWATHQQTLWMPTSVPVSEHGYNPDLWGGHAFLPFQGAPSQMLPPLSTCLHYLLPPPVITQGLLSFSAGIPAPAAPPHCTSYQQPAVFSLSCCIFIMQPMPLSWELGLTVSSWAQDTAKAGCVTPLSWQVTKHVKPTPA